MKGTGRAVTKRINCPVCGSGLTRDLISIEEFPYFNVPVSKSDKKSILRTYDLNKLTSTLDVMACMNCAHCYIETLPDEEIITDLYGNYYNYPSPLDGSFRPERDNRFLDFFVSRVEPMCRENKMCNILEVACYDGYVLYHLHRRGFDVTGCDPSDGAAIGEKYGLEIMRRFFNADDFISKNLTYDIVISRHFIEHVSGPDICIKDLLKILNPGGFLILETPDIEFYLDKGLIEAFSLQHLHGFSRNSLSYALKRCGASVISSERVSDNLITVAEKGSTASDMDSINGWEDTVRNFRDKFEESKKKIQDSVSEFIHCAGPVGLWGAGGFGLTALSFYGLPVESIRFIIDSDPGKTGMEYLTHSIPIISPDKAGELRPVLIIITSMYSDSILRQIKEKRFNCAVITIFPEVSLLRSAADILHTVPVTH